MRPWLPQCVQIGLTSMVIALFHPGFVPLVQAAPGDLDPTFGDTEGTLLSDLGIAMTDVGDQINDGLRAVFVLPDGKILAVGETVGDGTCPDCTLNGDIGVVRYHSNGLEDTTFGTTGVIVREYPDPDTANPQPLTVSDAALQADGKIVVVGYTNVSLPELNNLVRGRYGLVRLNADGSIDTSFGTNGGVKTGFGDPIDQAQPVSVAIQGDGKIVVVGRLIYGEHGAASDFTADFLVARYNANGSLDTTFDGDGWNVTDFGANANDVVYGVRIQADGKIVVVGYATPVAGQVTRMAVARYNANGSLDTGFDGDGRVTTNLTDAATLTSAVIQADGKIVVAGYNYEGNSLLNALDFVVARYTTTGGLDGTFGAGGIVTTDFAGVRDWAHAIELDADGKILVAGATNNVTQGDFSLARYNTNGSLDTTFHDDGRVSIPIFGDFLRGSTGAVAMALQSDGKPVLGGTVDTEAFVRGWDYTVTRHLVAESAAVTLSSITLNPATVVGGASSTGTATLTAAAPAGGQIVSLSSSNTSVATVPASVTVAAGATSAIFTVTTSSVTASTVVTISGTAGGVTKTADLTVSPGNDTGLKSPTANAADSGGDRNGYQTTPANAHADDTLNAVDTDSGNGTSTSCTSTNKDKHRFYNYNFSIPSGVAIKGIEVRLDAKADSTSGSPKICVQLSWNGGASWTTAKSTPTLGTTMTSFTLGSATDTWGRTWSVSNFSNANFRVRVIDVASSTARDFSLDWVAVQVHYQ